MFYICMYYILREHLYSIGINIKNNIFVLYKPEITLYIVGYQ